MGASGPPPGRSEERVVETPPAVVSPDDVFSDAEQTDAATVASALPPPDAGDDGAATDGVISSSLTVLTPFSDDEPLKIKLPQLFSKSEDDAPKAIGNSQLRYRYMDEKNRLRPPDQTGRDTYGLWRVTPSLEMDLNDVQLMVQVIDAVSFGEELPPAIIDENRFDLLQYWGDVPLTAYGDGKLRFRYGRQFLKYGSQHLVSDLPWANTYRNFEGGRLYYTSAAWNIDAFLVSPVNAVAGNVVRSRSRDIADQSQYFGGIYASYLEAPLGKIDLFWLWLDEQEPKDNRHDGLLNTLGARYFGEWPVQEGESRLLTWLWDLEGGGQWGRDNFVAGGPGLDVIAGYLSLSAGATVDAAPWKPTFKGIFWYGSGDRDPNDGRINTFHTLFPLGHSYWGQLDNLNGSNLLDYGLQCTVKPLKKLSFDVQYHWLNKASDRDFIYNITGAPLGDTSTPEAHIQNELDLVATYTFDEEFEVQSGYMWGWYGAAVNDQPSLARGDARQFYVMATLKF